MSAVKEKVYVLHHVHTPADSQEEQVKLIGVYSSNEQARAAILRLSSQPGFRETIDGFHVDPIELDKDHWEEGFISWAEALT